MTKDSINHLTNRDAMRLPNFFSGSICDYISDEFNKVRYNSKDELIAQIKSLHTSLSTRIAAATVLGHIGDPRINTYQPAMQLIDGDKISIGTNSENIDKIYNQFKNIGVKYEWIEKETPEFDIELESFKIALHPVTNQEYRDFLVDSRWSELPSSWPFGKYPHYAVNHPVFGISVAAAEAYTKWLAKKTQRLFRLPSEIEWEYAAAGPLRNIYPWGNIFSDLKANTLESNILCTTPIGIYEEGKSVFGLYDMAGNVEEYVADNYWVYPKGRFINDDLALLDPNYRITRGGSFTRFADLARCTRRHGFYPKDLYAIGFRLAETI